MATIDYNVPAYKKRTKKQIFEENLFLIQRIEMLENANQKGHELENELRDVKGSRDAYCKWCNEKNIQISKLKDENNVLKKLIDKQHEELQEIKNKLKDIISN